MTYGTQYRTTMAGLMDGADDDAVAAVDPGGVANQHIADVLTVLAVGHVRTPFGCTTIRGGPSDLRARSSASGTSSSPMTFPTAGNGSSRREAMAAMVPYQS